MKSLDFGLSNAVSHVFLRYLVMKLSLVESPPLNVPSHERSFTEHTIKKNVHVTAR